MNKMFQVKDITYDLKDSNILYKLKFNRGISLSTSLSKIDGLVILNKYKKNLCMHHICSMLLKGNMVLLCVH